jgi:UDP-3-O-[3-hydroxymyristoyl] glucosamine N-acyltransferase
MYDIFDYSEIFIDAKVEGHGSGRFTSFETINNANSTSISWINPLRNDKYDLFERTKAGIVICPVDSLFKPSQEQLLIKSINPKLIFIKLMNEHLKISQKSFISTNSSINSKAIIGKNVSIGDHCFIGECVIGDNTIIKTNVFIGNQVEIGANGFIQSGTVIGSEGFGYVKDEKGINIKFPHIGGVKIGDNVDVGANVCIDRGTLSDTIIQNDVKIDNLVHIAHNSLIKNNSKILPTVVICGSCIIGENSWISPGSIIRDAINVGENSIIGMGSVVTKHVPDNQIWMGSPAKFLKKNIQL